MKEARKSMGGTLLDCTSEHMARISGLHFGLWARKADELRLHHKCSHHLPTFIVMQKRTTVAWIAKRFAFMLRLRIYSKK
jgi:hypothetical protein